MTLGRTGRLLAAGALSATMLFGIACGDDDDASDAADSVPTATVQDAAAEDDFVADTESEVEQLRQELNDFEDTAASMDASDQDALEPLLEDLRTTISDIETHLTEYSDATESEREAVRIEIEDLLASAQSEVEQIQDVMDV